jgi:hypothetical protein
MSATTGLTSTNTLTIATAVSLTTSIVLDATKTNFIAAQGVKLGGIATVHGVKSGAMIELAGAMAGGSLTAELGADTASDTVVLKLNPTYTDNHDATSTYTYHGITFNAPGLESLYVTSTATASATSTAGTAKDGVENSLSLEGADLTTLVITGDQPISIFSELLDSAGLAKLEVVDASRLVAPSGLSNTINGSFGFSFNSTYVVPLKLLVGSQHSTNQLFGTELDNAIVGGELDDAIYGGSGADTLTGSGGDDRFAYEVSSDYHMDRITDFVANTVGNGLGGAANSTGAAATEASRNGDVIDLSWFELHSIHVDVAGSTELAEAQIAGAQAAGGYDAYAALDSSTGLLLIDWGSGTAIDQRIQLDGVTTIGTATFLLNTNIG